MQTSGQSGCKEKPKVGWGYKPTSFSPVTHFLQKDPFHKDSMTSHQHYVGGGAERADIHTYELVGTLHICTVIRGAAFRAPRFTPPQARVTHGSVQTPAVKPRTAVPPSGAEPPHWVPYGLTVSHRSLFYLYTHTKNLKSTELSHNSNTQRQTLYYFP